MLPAHDPVSDAASVSEAAATFGRPAGVEGSFAPDAVPADRPQPQIAPPDAVLAEAFRQPAGETETLQRDPYAQPEPDETPEPDPWRDPDSAVGMSAPAVGADPSTGPTLSGPKMGIRDVLFGGRVHWWALATLGLLALFVGLFGGLVGRWTAEVVTPLHANTVHLEGESPDSDGATTNVERVAKAAANSVVTIEVRTAVDGGSGSGFIVDKAGYIVTNNHVISKAANDSKAKLEVVFSDRQRVPARLVGRDVKTDLAVIKVDDVANLTVAKLGDSDKLQIGQEVIAFGSPLGLDKTVTSGIVSALDRPVPLRPDADSDTDAVINAIQTDASINPGNSGGPLLNDDGQVIGVNTAGAMTGGGSIGLGFAIPINEVIPIANTLIKDGKVKHPSVGITAATVRNDRIFGAEVKDVAPGSPAAQAGLREGDVITKFNGRSIEGADELTVAVRTSKIGEPVKFTYWRDGRYFDGELTPVSD
ncbi:S1C family serine protease [Gordonia neofelifaecis]|uniref:Peptidase S1 and S6 chymotrypsin/Hap n=1 Tax=Gordonia neofelifaecis NRRL B-59395 TaxID=644548 RepID=F1YFA6_9ACTN|nr:trypsin-like peptidase domain-containing protein [Gordonia neofelifaecis]EGD56645.1 peptidase S1 and S6 chymotrypsin/Hap [Gordonia neofelifaecis NRRL B-59395]